MESSSRRPFLVRHLSTIAAAAGGLSAPWLLLAPSWVAYAVITALLVALLVVFALSSRRTERD